MVYIGVTTHLPTFDPNVLRHPKRSISRISWIDKSWRWDKNEGCSWKKRTPPVFFLKMDFKHGTSTIHMEVKNGLKVPFLWTFFLQLQVFLSSLKNFPSPILQSPLNKKQRYILRQQKVNKTNRPNNQPISSPNLHISSQLFFPPL